MRPEVAALFDDATDTISYVVVNPSTKRCAVIDSVLDHDPDAARTDKRSANQIVEFVPKLHRSTYPKLRGDNQRAPTDADLRHL